MANPDHVLASHFSCMPRNPPHQTQVLDAQYTYPIQMSLMQH